MSLLMHLADDKSMRSNHYVPIIRTSSCPVSKSLPLAVRTIRLLSCGWGGCGVSGLREGAVQQMRLLSRRHLHELLPGARLLSSVRASSQTLHLLRWVATTQTPSQRTAHEHRIPNRVAAEVANRVTDEPRHPF